MTRHSSQYSPTGPRQLYPTSDTIDPEMAVDAPAQGLSPPGLPAPQSADSSPGCHPDARAGEEDGGAGAGGDSGDNGDRDGGGGGGDDGGGSRKRNSGQLLQTGSLGLIPLDPQNLEGVLISSDCSW